jgi:hypothetical protein
MSSVPVVHREDNRNGIIAAFAVFLLTLLLLFLIKTHEPDPPKMTIPVPIAFDEGIDDFEIHNAGGGAPSAVTQPTPVPQPAAQEQPTQTTPSPVRVPPSTSTTSGQTSGQESTPASPFGGSGSGGSGTSGSGGGFGSDIGPGTGSGTPGTGGSGERIRRTNLTSNPRTPNSQTHTIALKLIVDANGTVISVSEIRERTTTTNQVLIDEVKELVKKEVKYESKPGAPNETTYYTITVKPT